MPTSVEIAEPLITEQEKPPTVDLLDWIFFLPYLFCFFTLLIGCDVLQRIFYYLAGDRGQEIVISLNNALHIKLLSLLGVKIEIDRPKEFSEPAPYIVVANHQSLFDIPILSNLFAGFFPKFIAKSELSKNIPTVSFALRKGGHCVINRTSGASAVKSIIKLGKLITERKLAAVIFPEGTRGRKGQLRKFQRAGVTALMKAAPQAAIIPVTIDNTWKLTWRTLRPVPRNTIVKIKIGQTISRSSQEDCDVLVKEIEGIILSSLVELRNLSNV